MPCHKGEYGPAEDAHMIIDHLVHAYLSASIRSDSSPVANTEEELIA